MHKDQVDMAMQQIARDYHSYLVAAKDEYTKHPEKASHKKLIAANAGTDAMNNLIASIEKQGGKPINEPRTGVDSAGPGMTKFDVLFTLHDMDIYLEVQSSGKGSPYKDVQLQGQIIGFAHVSAGAKVPARYYKIVGFPREISRWSRRAAQHGLAQGKYDAQVVMSY
jgi:hypothetical protein